MMKSVNKHTIDETLCDITKRLQRATPHKDNNPITAQSTAKVRQS